MIYVVLFLFCLSSISRTSVHCSLIDQEEVNYSESLCRGRSKDILLNTIKPVFELRGYVFIIWEGTCGLELSRIWESNAENCCHTSVSFDINAVGFFEIMHHLKSIPNNPPFLKSSTVIWLLSWQRILDAFELIHNYVSLQSVTQQRSAHLILSVYNDFDIPPHQLTFHLLGGMTVYFVIVHQGISYIYNAEYAANNFTLIPLNLNSSVPIILEPSSKRIKLNGTQLKVCSMPEYPFSSVTTHPNGSVTWNDGFDMKLISLLANHFNFSVQMMYPDDVEINGFKLKRQWHSIIQALQHRKVDLGVAELMVTLKRSKKVDFSRYYFSEPLVIVSKKPGQLPRTFIVFRPFESLIWLMIGLSFFAFALAFLLSSILSQRINSRVHRTVKLQFNLTTFNHYLWLAFGGFFRAFPIRVPAITSQRILVVFWGFFAFILTAFYQGSLTSHLTIPIQESPVDSLIMMSDKMDVSDMTWITFDATSIMDRFTDNPTGIYKILNDKRISRKVITPKESSHDNIDMTLTENLAFFIGASVASYETAKIGKAKFHIGKQGFFIQRYSIAFQRGSPLVNQFNDVISRIVESGITERWVKEFVLEMEHKTYELEESKVNDNTIELEDVQGAFLILFVGYALSCFEISRIWESNAKNCCRTLVSFDINAVSFFEIMHHLKSIPNNPPFFKSSTVIWLLSWQRTLDVFKLIHNNVSLQTVTQQRSAHLIFSIYNDFDIPPRQLTLHLLGGMTVYIAIIHQGKSYIYFAEYAANKFTLMPLNLNSTVRVILKPSTKWIKLSGTQIKICSIPEYPFSSVTTYPNGNVTWNDGFDKKLITLLANYFNFSVQMLYPDDIEINGTKLKRQWHNIIKALKYRKVDLGISELVMTLNRSKRVDFSRCYFSEHLVIVSKKPGQLPRTFIVFRPFQSLIWLMIGLSFFIFALAFLISRLLSQQINASVYGTVKLQFNFTTFNRYLWLAFGGFFRAFPIRVSATMSQRMLVVFWGFFAFILTAVYQGSLTSHLTIPIQESPIDSLRMMSDKMDVSRITWIATNGSSHMDRFTDNPTGIYKILNDKRLSRKLVTPKQNAHDNIEMTLTENLAFFVGATVASYETAKIGKDKFHIGKQGFFNQQYTIAFQRGSPLVNQFNDVISRIVESGITERWVQEFVFEMEYKNYESEESKVNDNTIELEDLQGAFLLLFVGYAVSLSIFIGELFLGRNKT